jgi:hypothetical protein
VAKLKGQFAEVWVDVSGTKTKVAGLQNWSLSTSSEKIESTAAGNSWATHEVGILSWEGEAELNEVDSFWFGLLTGGAKVSIDFYTADKTTIGTVFYSGTASLDGDIESPYDDLHGISVTFTGSGELTKSTVAV